MIGKKKPLSLFAQIFKSRFTNIIKLKRIEEEANEIKDLAVVWVLCLR